MHLIGLWWTLLDIVAAVNQRPVPRSPLGRVRIAFDRALAVDDHHLPGVPLVRVPRDTRDDASVVPGEAQPRRCIAAETWSAPSESGIAGLVLLDPTPINDPRGCAGLERIMSMVGRRAATGRRVVLESIGNLDLAQLAVAVRSITKLSAEFSADRLPRLPAVVVTADRKPTSSIARRASGWPSRSGPHSSGGPSRA